MSDPRPQITTLDLRTEVPTGVKLVGLSDAKFDGINYYRELEKDSISIKFNVKRDGFVQIDYQPYSSSQNVETSFSLNGKKTEKTLYKKGVFKDHFISGNYVRSGENYLKINYYCVKEGCKKDIRQYWTKIQIIDNKFLPISNEIGINYVKMNLGKDDSLLKARSQGKIFFDGKNLLRHVESKSFDLYWMNGRPLSTSAFFFSANSFRISTIVQGKTVAVQQGDKDNGVSVAVSLARFPEARSVSFRVECLGSPVKTGCAYLYFPQVAVSTAPPVSVGGQLGVVALVMLCLLGLWAWLRPVPVSGGGSFR